MAYRSSIHPDPIEEHIDRTISYIMDLLHKRRAQLLLQALNARKDMRDKEASRQKAMTELKELQLRLVEKMRVNPLLNTQHGMVHDMKAAVTRFQRDIPLETRSEWTCDTAKIERSISDLGMIFEVEVGLPRYATLHTPVAAAGKRGRAPGEFSGPYGVAIHEPTNRIFVADNVNSRVEIFSEKGEYLDKLGEGQLNGPYGIAIRGDNVFVSCWDNTINKLSLTDMSLVRTRGSFGADSTQFNFPSQLTIDGIGQIFIADSDNNRICVYDVDLFHQGNVTHESMVRPLDVKTSYDLLYVLCPQENPCMLVLTLEGVMQRSLISCGRGMDVSGPIFFCLDVLNNFVMSDQESHSIRVFSPEGNLLHEIGREGHDQGSFYRPQGVAITPNKKLVCVSNNRNYALQIFV